MVQNYQIVWRGIVHDTQGYSRASREYLLALDRLGVDVKIEPLNFGTPPARLLPSQAKRIRELIDKPLAKDKKRILIYHSQPYGVNPIEERAKGYDKVIIKTVWETTKIPSSWFPNINQADAVMVPSSMNVRALQESGVTAPILLVPHGADIETFNSGIPALNIDGTSNTFNFLSIFQWQHRKSPDVLLKAFWDEFSYEDNVSLILKTYWGNSGIKEDQRQVRNRIIDYKSELGYGNDRAPVYYSGSLFNDVDMRSIYSTADVFVLPSRGEGVGLPYMEAMASGIPCIATGWGGQTDFINRNNGYLIDYDLAPTQVNAHKGISPSFNQLFTNEMHWAEPRVESLRKIMRDVYNNQELAKTKGEVSRKTMELMTWDKIGIILKESIEEVIG